MDEQQSQKPSVTFQIVSAQLAQKTAQSHTVRLFIVNQSPDDITVHRIGFICKQATQTLTLNTQKTLPANRLGTIELTLGQEIRATRIDGFTFNGISVNGEIRRHGPSSLQWAAYT